MSTIVRIPVMELTAKNFAPFGSLLSARDEAPDFNGLQSHGWRADYQVTGNTLIYTLRSEQRGFTFTKLERHFDVSQTFIPLGTETGLVAVAPPTGEEPPGPEQLVGFVLNGEAGYVLNRGVWHSLDRYPTKGDHFDVVMITGERTQDDIVANAPDDLQLSEQVDYEQRYGVVFELER